MAKSFDPYEGLLLDDEDEENTSVVETKTFDPYAGLLVETDTPIVEEEKEEIPVELAPPKPKEFQTPEDAYVDEELSFNELASDDDYMSMLREYQSNRFGEDGNQKEDETNSDYLKRFLSHTREFEFNSIDMGRQLDWVRTADEEQRMKFGYLYSQLDKLPSFYEEGGTGSISALRDFGKSLITDPLNYIGFGAGKVAGFVATRGISQALKQGGKKLAIEEAAKLSAKRMLGTKAGKIAAGGVAVEAGAAAVQDLKQQELDLLSEKYGEATPEEKNYLRASLVGGIGLGAGALGVKLSGGLGGDKILQNAQEARKKQNSIVEELNARNKKFGAEEAVKRSDEATNSATGVFDTDAGRQTLDMLGEVDKSGLTEPQFRVELMQRVGRVATDVVRELAETGRLGEMVDADTKASEVIGKLVKDSIDKVDKKSSKKIQEQTKRMLIGDKNAEGVLDKLGDIDSDILEGAISRAGLTPKQFIDSMGASYSDAGKYLQTASSVGKIMKGLAKTDPELEAALKEFTDANNTTSIMGKGHEFMKRLDRERRALMVTQIATTVRNVASAGIRLTMETPAAAIESILYQVGRNSNAAMTGTLTKEQLKGSFRDVIRDSFGSLDRMRQAGATANISDALLKHNTQLATRMDRSLQEVGADESLTRATRMLNGLNIAQDMFFRKAIFVDTIEKRMRRAGIIVNKPTKVGQYKSIEEFSASGKTLPTKFLQEAVEDSLAFTFARMPKQGGSKSGDTIGYWFIKTNEAIGPAPLPLGTAAFPFSKFMVNALQFQFQYSPLSVVSSAFNTGSAMAKRRKALANAAKGSELADLATKQGKEADAAFRKAREDFSKGVVGTTALMAAIKYRSENQNVKWYEHENEDGTTSDLRPFFPLTPYLAVADLYVKISENKTIDTKEFLEGFTGAQFRTGASSALLENFFETLSGKDVSSERLSEMVGEHVGEVFGGFTTPLRVVRDVRAAYDTEAATVRDARQTEGVDKYDRFTSALTNKIKKDLPGFADDLPEFESPTREGAVYRQSSMIGQLTGMRKEAERNPAEKELTRLQFKNWRITPTTGDKTADAMVKKYMGIEVENRLAKLVQKESYKKKTDNQKKAAIKNMLSRYTKTANRLAKLEAFKDKEKPYTPFDRGQFSRMTDLQKRLVEDYYDKNYDGRSVSEMQELEPNVNHLRKALRIGRLLARREVIL